MLAEKANDQAGLCQNGLHHCAGHDWCLGNQLKTMHHKVPFTCAHMDGMNHHLPSYNDHTANQTTAAAATAATATADVVPVVVDDDADVAAVC